MEVIPGWNFLVAPHVKTKTGRLIRSDAPNVLIDRGSTRSIDMTYTQAADLYIGDASSQVYEFIRTPRPCIFLNLDRIDWRSDPAYSHWQLGQVIDSLEELPGALVGAADLQPRFEQAQREMLARSIDHSKIRRRTARPTSSWSSQGVRMRFRNAFIRSPGWASIAAKGSLNTPE